MIKAANGKMVLTEIKYPFKFVFLEKAYGGVPLTRLLEVLGRSKIEPTNFKIFSYL